MWPNVGRTQVVEDQVIFNKFVQFRQGFIVDVDSATGFQWKWDAINSRIMARDAADTVYADVAVKTLYPTTSIVFPQTTAGTPIMTLGADTNTGWFQTAANRWQFAQGGVETIRFDLAG